MKKSDANISGALQHASECWEDYACRFYVPSALAWDKIREDQFRGVRELTAWIKRLKENWARLRILEKRTDTPTGIELGKSLKVEVVADLGPLSPEDLSVDIYYGRVDSKADFLDRAILSLREHTSREDGRFFAERSRVQRLDASDSGSVFFHPIPSFRIRIPWV